MKLVKRSFSGLVAQAVSDFDRIVGNNDREDYLHLLEGKLSRFVWKHFGEKEFTNPKNKIRSRRITYLASCTLLKLIDRAIEKDPYRKPLQVFRNSVNRDMHNAWVNYERAIDTKQGSWIQQIKFYFDSRKYHQGK